MPDTETQIKFDAPATLRRWPSPDHERFANELPDVVAEGTLDECIRQFTAKPMSQVHLYEIHTAPQGEVITGVLSGQRILELAAMWGFL